MKNKDSPSFLRIIEELRRVKGNERALVLTANGYCELLTEILIKEKCKNWKKIKEDNRSYSYSSKLVILNEMGVIGDSLNAHLDRFRKLRNRAAHDSIFEIHGDDRKTFLHVTGSPNTDIGIHCIILLVLFWKCGSDIFNKALKKETEPNQAPEPTTLSVTPCAPSSTGRARQGRGSS